MSRYDYFSTFSISLVSTFFQRPRDANKAWEAKQKQTPTSSCPVFAEDGSLWTDWLKPGRVNRETQSKASREETSLKRENKDVRVGTFNISSLSIVQWVLMLLCCLFRQALNNIIGCAASSGPDALGQKNTHIHFNQGSDGTLGFAMLWSFGSSPNCMGEVG